MQVTILASSDMHGYILPTNYGQRNVDLPFGTAKLASAVKAIKKASRGPVFQIENGDFIQGSPLSYFVRKEEGHEVDILAQVLNTMGVDAGILGNHEFNYGIDYLRQAIQAYKHPILCANILDEAGQPAFGQAYTILEKEGVKLAILGLTTPYIPHWEQPATIKGLTFVSALETAKKYVPMLRDLADIVLVSYHGGFERDLETGLPTELLTGENEGYQIAMEVEGIDAFITGHQHRVIATHINGVPVIQPGYRGTYLGKITLDLAQGPEGWQVVDSQAELIEMGGYEADPEIMALMDGLDEEVESWLDQPAGQVVGDMTITDPHAARLKEHPYIEFINKVQMHATGAPISGTALFNNEGKGFNNQITMRDIITNYIYPNTLAVVELTGADLRAALEQTAQYFVVEDGQIVFNPKYILPKPQYYNYDMYEGIDYVLDFYQPMGQRVCSLTFQGKNVEDSDRLEVVVNQYRAVGGGNYAMFSADKIVREVQIDMTELIADYLKAHPVIQATTNQNYRVASVD